MTRQAFLCTYDPSLAEMTIGQIWKLYPTEFGPGESEWLLEA